MTRNTLLCVVNVRGGGRKVVFLSIQKSRLLLYFFTIDVRIRGVAQIWVRKFFISVLCISFQSIDEATGKSRIL